MKVVQLASHITKSGLWLFCGHSLSLVLSFVLNIFLARLLPSNEFGLYTITMFAPSFLLTFTDWGINTALIRYLSLYQSNGEFSEAWETLKAGVLFKFLVGFGFAFILWAFSNTISFLLNRTAIEPLVQLTSLVLIAQVIHETSFAGLIGVSKPDKAALLMIIQSLFRVIIAISLVYFGYGLRGAILGIGLGYLASGLLGLILVLRAGHHFSNACPRLPTDYFTRISQLCRFGLPLFIGSIASWGISNFLHISLPWFENDINIANYRVASYFTYPITMLTIPLTTSFLPTFSKLSNEHHQHGKLTKLFSFSVRYSAFLVLPVAFALMLLSNEIVNVIFGGTYAAASIYAVGYVLLGFAVLLGHLSVGNILESQGETISVLKMNLLKSLLMVILCLLLIRLFGILGFIAGIVLSSFAMHIYGLGLVMRKFKLKLDYKYSCKLLGLSLMVLIMTKLLLFAFPTLDPLVRLVIGGFFFFTSYFALSPIVGVINIEDIKNFDVLARTMKSIYPLFRIIIRIQLWLVNRLKTRKPNVRYDFT